MMNKYIIGSKRLMYALRHFLASSGKRPMNIAEILRLVEVRTEYPPNTSPEPCHCKILLNVTIHLNLNAP